MKTFALLLLCIGTGSFAQKMHITVISHTVDGVPFVRYAPGIALRNGNATVNCAAYGNTANCSGNESGNSIFLPAHTVEGSLNHIQMLLQLPDGRRVGVYCNDHFGSFAQSHLHTCKNPEVDELEADFSSDKVKLTWGIGLDGKKKESETYTVGKVFPSTPPTR